MQNQMTVRVIGKKKKKKKNLYQSKNLMSLVKPLKLYTHMGRGFAFILSES